MYDLTFYPDKPITAAQSRLIEWDYTGNFICQQKSDGWRMEIEFLPDKTLLITRHGKNYTSTVDKAVLEACKRLRALVPPFTRIDSEWRSLRESSHSRDLPEVLFVFDVVRWDNEWLFKQGYEDRWNRLLQVMKAFGPDDRIMPSETAAPGDFVNYYERQKEIPWSEGVVVKHRKSKLIADRKSSGDNPQWFKVKYRGGVDGEVRGAR